MVSRESCQQPEVVILGKDLALGSFLEVGMEIKKGVSPEENGAWPLTGWKNS